MALFLSSPSVTSSLRFYSWQIGYNSHFVTVGASSFLPLQMLTFESRKNKMRARFVYDCQKESVLTLFNNPLFFSIFRFKRVDVFDRTRRHICIYCVSAVRSVSRSRWSMTIVNKKKIILFLFYLPQGEDLFFLFVKFLVFSNK